MAQPLKMMMCFLALCLAMSVTAGCSDDDTGAVSNNTANHNTPDVREDASNTDGSDDEDASPDTTGEDASPDTTGEDASPDTTGEDASPDATDEDASPDATDDDASPDATDDPDTSEPEVVCGARAGDTCAEDEFCKFPDGTICDYADATGICTPRPAAACPAVYQPVCGCDGQTYGNECEAQSSGTDVASEGVCDGSASCDAQDARAQGMCDMEIGVFWDGGLCVTLSGCSCVGDDCDSSYDSMEQCEAAHSNCPTDCRTDGCPNATDRCGMCWTSYACIPEGAAC